MDHKVGDGERGCLGSSMVRINSSPSNSCLLQTVGSHLFHFPQMLRRRRFFCLGIPTPPLLLSLSQGDSDTSEGLVVPMSQL